MENLGQCRYFKLPVFITSRVMGLRSSHCFLNVSVATHKMASPSHGVLIRYRSEKTSSWIRGKSVGLHVLAIISSGTHHPDKSGTSDLRPQRGLCPVPLAKGWGTTRAFFIH